MSDDDSTVYPDWDAQRRESQQRRARHREQSAAVLRERGIPFNVHNKGAHLIVNGPKGSRIAFDFWPGTGLWKERNGGTRRGRGVMALIKALRV